MTINIQNEARECFFLDSLSTFISLRFTNSWTKQSITIWAQKLYNYSCTGKKHATSLHSVDPQYCHCRPQLFTFITWRLILIIKHHNQYFIASITENKSIIFQFWITLFDLHLNYTLRYTFELVRYPRRHYRIHKVVLPLQPHTYKLINQRLDKEILSFLPRAIVSPTHSTHTQRLAFPNPYTCTTLLHQCNSLNKTYLKISSFQSVWLLLQLCYPVKIHLRRISFKSSLKCHLWSRYLYRYLMTHFPQL